MDGADVFGIECCVSIALLVLAWYSTVVVFYVPERNIMHLTVQSSLLISNSDSDACQYITRGGGEGDCKLAVQDYLLLYEKCRLCLF